MKKQMTIDKLLVAPALVYNKPRRSHRRRRVDFLAYKSFPLVPPVGYAKTFAVLISLFSFSFVCFFTVYCLLSLPLFSISNYLYLHFSLYFASFANGVKESSEASQNQ